jgi:cytochrome c oxidase subunit 3
MTTLDTHHDADHHDHHPRMGHHWSSMQQQFEAGKLGMWLFLGTEFLLFGGLFCAYAVLRHNQPELFAYGSQFLDTKWGAINTVVLIVSSLTMALAVSAAQLGKRNALCILLALTFLGGVGFMTIKYVEYKHKFHEHYLWGTKLYEPVHHETAAEQAPPVAYAGGQVDLAPRDVLATESGMPLPVSAVAPPAAAPTGLAALDEAHQDRPVASEVKHEHVHDGHDVPNPRTDPNRPANAHLFFGVYFCMTGLHGFHVLAGMAVIGWLFFRGLRGEFGPGYFTPVDLGGLYWHVVDLIWIFLFPLLYLI